MIRAAMLDAARYWTAVAVAVAVLLPVGAGGAGAAPPGWQDTATPLRGNTRGLVLDHGRPRVLHNDGDRLAFAWCDAACHEASAWTSVDIATGIDLDGSDLAIDRSGRLHAAYIDLARDGVFYATCATGCGQANAWAHAQVDATNAYAGLSLAADPWGRPRLAYVRFPNWQFVFAACDDACDASSGWSTVALNQSGAYPSLALEGANPRIAMAQSVSPRGREVRYLACDADCLNKRAWTTTPVAWFDDVGNPSLAVEEGGRAHVAFNPIGPAATSLAYTRCEGACTSEANWADPALITPGQRIVGWPQLAVVGGRPGIAYDHCDGCFTPAEENYVKYAACDSDCAGANARGWAVAQLATGAGLSYLAMDGERPRLAYRAGDLDAPGLLRYATCDACGAPGSWPSPPASPPPPSWPPPGSSPTGGGGVDPPPATASGGTAGASGPTTPGQSAGVSPRGPGAGAPSEARRASSRGDSAAPELRFTGVPARAGAARSGGAATSSNGAGSSGGLEAAVGGVTGTALDLVADPVQLLGRATGLGPAGVVAVLLLSLDAWVLGVEARYRRRIRRSGGRVRVSLSVGPRSASALGARGP